MIKNWSKFNEAFRKGEKILTKIEILEDLSLDLKDKGLKVDIWNGSWRDNGGSYGVGMNWELPSKSIIMMIEDTEGILDPMNYWENELKNKAEIQEFEQTLIDYGFTPVAKSGFSNKAYFLFDKGKKTDSELVSSHKRRINENSSDNLKFLIYFNI